MTEEPRTVLYGGRLPGKSTAKWLAIKEYCYTHPGKTGMLATPAGSFYVTYYPRPRDMNEDRSPEDSGLCCTADHANAVPPTCKVPHARKDVSHDAE